MCIPQQNLVGGWTNPFEKYARQIGSFPQVRDEKNKYLKPPPRNPWHTGISELYCFGT